MSPSPRSSLSSLVLVLVLFVALSAAVARADQALFEARGEVSAAAPRAGVAVRLALRNVGNLSARDLRIEGVMAGLRGRAEIAGAVAAQAEAEAVLRLPAAPLEGTQALVLRIEYESVRRDGVALPGAQCTFVLLTFGGAATAPPVRIDVPPVRLVLAQPVSIALRSTDGRPHRVRLELYAPRGFGAVPFRQLVAVPASGAATAAVRVVRSSSPEAGSASLLAVAATEGESLVGTAVAEAPLEITIRPAALTRLRGALVVAAVLLLAWTAYAQRAPVRA